mmetsp:Transcript_24346/g.60380  ORF Transcript_24346/g.60380 Transcript_24346/m.60380 type:complete len:103 (-) Transcript_24346:228-536(-)
MATPPALAWANMHTPRRRFPKLQDLALDKLASNPDMLNDLRCLDEHQAIALLERIFYAARLDVRLACVFRDAGHPVITEAINSLDLIAAMPTHNALPACRKL